jgi:hypothetical protein
MGGSRQPRVASSGYGEGGREIGNSRPRSDTKLESENMGNPNPNSSS